MELSSEDMLRLNVLLANRPLAIRIHESSMTLHALLNDGEATVKLNANTNDERYLKQVRSFLSEHALGSPGGYPLYLQRWTRMGQMREQSLKQLLLLGDPAAVFAVVCAEGLTDELARRAWWAAEEPENARRLLQTEAVVQSETGRRLARFLVDYLPFETEPEAMMESVRVVLQPGLLDQEARLDLWKKAARKMPYLVGFIAALPDDLPQPPPARPDHAALEGQLSVLNSAEAVLLLRMLAGNGQAFLTTVRRILQKPPSQEVVARTLDALSHYFRALRPEGVPDMDLEQLQEDAARWSAASTAVQDILQHAPSMAPELKAMRLLSGVGYGILRPVLRGSDAMGSLMRRKLEPVMGPLLDEIGVLLGASGSGFGDGH